jgi:hypothetical protein
MVGFHRRFDDEYLKAVAAVQGLAGHDEQKSLVLDLCKLFF